MKKICYISGYGKESKCSELSVPNALDIKEAVSKTVDNIRGNYDEFISESNRVCKMYSVAPILLTASGFGSLSEKIITAFDPIIDLVSGLGYPVTNFMLIVGCLMVVTGRKKQGLEVLKWACVGYVGIQFMPFVLKMLNTLGAELRALV